MKVKEMEVEQRPREKALRNGLESLSDLELVREFDTPFHN